MSNTITLPINLTIAFKEQLERNLAPWLREKSLEAQRLINKQGLPHRRREAWKYTRLEKQLPNSFRQASEAVISHDEHLRSLLLADYQHIVLINGRYSEAHSSVKEADILFKKTEDLGEEDLDIFRDKAVSTEKQDAIYLLNEALLNNAFYIKTQKDKLRLQILHYSTSLESFHNAKLFFELDSHHKLDIVETFAGNSESELFTNTHNDFYLHANAHVVLTRIQKEQKNTTHFSNTRAFLQDHAQFYCADIQLGSRMVRHNLDVALEKAGAHASLLGLSCFKDGQHGDTQITIRHKSAHTTSEQLYKGIIDDKARCVFTGKVYVDQHAQQIEAKQLNKNLLLSPKAQAHSQPQLEIFADDVKCSHGSTTGQLSPQELFYFQSRGIDKDRAKRILTRAFASDVLLRLPHQDLARELKKTVEDSFFTKREE